MIDRVSTCMHVLHKKVNKMYLKKRVWLASWSATKVSEYFPSNNGLPFFMDECTSSIDRSAHCLKALIPVDFAGTCRLHYYQPVHTQHKGFTQRQTARLRITLTIG